MSRRRLVTTSARRRTVASPTDIPNLQYRWRAGTLSLVDGAAVTNWAPSAGNVTLSAAGSAQPTYISSAINGQPAVRFDGVDDKLAGSADFLPQPVSIFAAVKLDVSKNTHMVYNAEGIELYAEAGTWRGWGGSGIGDGPVLTSAATCAIWVANGGSSILDVNGTQLLGSVAGIGHNSAVTVGDYSSGGYGLKGDIAEIAVYQRALAQSEIAMLRAYSSARYGTQ